MIIAIYNQNNLKDKQSNSDNYNKLTCSTLMSQSPNIFFPRKYLLLQAQDIDQIQILYYF